MSNMKVGQREIEQMLQDDQQYSKYNERKTSKKPKKLDRQQSHQMKRMQPADFYSDDFE